MSFTSRYCGSPSETPPSLRCRPAAALTTLLAASVAVVGAGRVLPPPPTSPTAIADWIRAEGAPLACLALLRLALVVVIGWLILTTIAAVVARGVGTARAVRWTDGLLSPAQRRLLGVGLAATITFAQPAGALAATTPGPTATVATEAASPGHVTMTVVDEPTSDAPTTTTTPTTSTAPDSTTTLPETTTSSPDPTTTSTSPTSTSAIAPTSTAGAPPTSSRSNETTETTDSRSSASAPAVELMTIIGDEPPPSEAMVAPPASTETTSPETWTIQPGDHLWAVAQETLRAHSLDASDPAAATYLRSLIELNAAVFAVPGEPDLVYPGQVFTLPSLPTR